MKKYIISSLIAIFCLNTAVAQDKILHKTLDEITKELGKPVSEETTWGGGIAVFKISDSLYYSCYFMYPDSKCHQYTVSDKQVTSLELPILGGNYSEQERQAAEQANKILADAFSRNSSNSMQGGYGTWDLGGRDMIGALPSPAYNNQEEGRVVVTITVNPKGEVIGTRINNRTNTTNKQLRSAAEEAARKTKFNAISGKENQTCTITYYFKLK